MKMNTARNKLACTKTNRNVLDRCRDDRNCLTLVDLSMHPLLRQFQEMHFINLVLIHLEFITQLIDTSVSILILPNINHLLYKYVEAFSDIHLLIEAIICE